MIESKYKTWAAVMNLDSPRHSYASMYSNPEGLHPSLTCSHDNLLSLVASCSLGCWTKQTVQVKGYAVSLNCAIRYFPSKLHELTAVTSLSVRLSFCCLSLACSSIPRDSSQSKPGKHPKCEASLPSCWDIWLSLAMPLLELRSVLDVSCLSVAPGSWHAQKGLRSSRAQP